MTADEADRCGPPRLVFRSPAMPGFRFECRPVSAEPPDKTVAFMYRRNGEGYRQSGVGVFRDGAWTNDKGKPLEGELLWAAMIDER